MAARVYTTSFPTWPPRRRTHLAPLAADRLRQELLLGHLEALDAAAVPLAGVVRPRLRHAVLTGLSPEGAF
eukprot:15392829-Alexandrium_andersonii.AAC.1